MSVEGCSYFSGTEADKSNKDLDKNALQDSLAFLVASHPIYVTNIDQLRLRRYPDTKSKILTTFDENSLLYYMGEQTDYKEKISKYVGHWLKVKSIDGNHEGWVYGAEHFVTPFLKIEQLDSLKNAGKGIQPFQNLGRKDMTDLTGMNWSGTIPGTRYSGYFTFDRSSRPDLLDGRMIIRTKTIDRETHQIHFIPCYVDFEKGMASTDIICEEPITR